ncbi:MAG: family 16 glycosylhydrolase [Anaerolineae bacterium]|nr:family 16 glycosylhydrolase [Anaerolineae bacterium]
MFITQTGNGIVTQTENSIRLVVPQATVDTYSNAQIASYRRRDEITCVPPLRMTVIARYEGELHGTAGFGFWNAPGLRLPQALWFFHASPPNNMALAKDVPGSGWKAATLDAKRWQFLALLPWAPVGFLLMRIPALYQQWWGIGQRAIGVSEVLLDNDLMKSTHTYTLEWLPDEVRFLVDSELMLQTRQSPCGKLGFIAWVDNQYAIVTPQGRFGSGRVAAQNPQALILERIEIVAL